MMLSNRGRRSYESTNPCAVVIREEGALTAGTVVHPVSVRMNENKKSGGISGWFSLVSAIMYEVRV